MSPITEAVQRGISRGARLALNPTVENYRSLTTPAEDTMTAAWRMTGKSLRTSMDQMAESRERSSRRRD